MKKIRYLSIIPLVVVALSSCASLNKHMESAKKYYAENISAHKTLERALTPEQSAEIETLRLDNNSLVERKLRYRGIDEAKECLASRQGEDIDDPRSYYSKPSESAFSDCLYYGREINDELIAEAQERKAQREAAQRAAEARQQARREAERQKRACLNSERYKRAVAAFVLRHNNKKLRKAKRELAHERKVEDMSGVRDLSARRRLAETKINATEKINEGFALYKRYGGSASSPGNIRSTESRNPCHAKGQWSWIGPGLSSIR